MKWKDISVFISSTFNDMHAERDYVLKNVFPQLGEWCEQKHIFLRDIDLRWGVTPQDSQTRNTIYKCLTAVDSCRPFFLCFLGQRRGWVPTLDRINQKTCDTFPEIVEMASAESRSATEYEIEHALLMPLAYFENGTLHRNEPVQNALFLRRKPDYLADLSEAQKKIFLDWQREKCATPEDYADYLRSCHEANKTTYARIAEKNPILDYSCRWDRNITSPELFIDEPEDDRAQGRLTDFAIHAGDLPEELRLQLLKVLKTEFPNELPTGDFWPLKAYLLAAYVRQFLPYVKEEPPTTDRYERDAEQQRVFRDTSLKDAIPRREELDRLGAYCDGDSSVPMLVLAEAGMGKTTLMAQFSAFRKGKTLVRFLGGSELSGDMLSLWESILHEEGLPAPADLDTLKRDFPELLASMAPCVLILDGIEQIPGGREMLEMIPMPLPPGVKIIVSLRSDLYREELERYLRFHTNYPRLRLRPFTDGQKRELIQASLRSSLKELSPELTDLVCGLDESGNPLYLSILLCDVRSFGSSSRLQREIQRHGRTPLSAFDAVLARMEGDRMFDMLPPDRCVPLVFGLLAFTRDGLSYDELTDCLKRYFPDCRRETCAGSLQICLRQVRAFLRRIDGRTDFRHQAFRTAAQQRYAGREREFHEVLAGLFRGECDPAANGSFPIRDQRALREYAWQLSFVSESDYSRLYENVCWVNARCENQYVRDLIREYDVPALRKHLPYRDLLIRYRDGLESNQNLFPSLLWTYSTEKQRKNAGFEGLHCTWLKMDGLCKESAGTASALEAANLRIIGESEYHAAAFCFAGNTPYAFVFAGQGKVIAYDLRTLMPLGSPIFTAKAMPLGLCASDRVLAAAFENETIELYAWEADGSTLRSKPLTTLSYLPPLYSGAAMCFDDSGRLWFQAVEEALASFEPESKDLAGYSLPGAEEISSLASAGTSIYGTACAGRNTQLFCLDASGAVRTRDLGEGDSRMLCVDEEGCLVSCAASGGRYPLLLVNEQLETLLEDRLRSPVTAALRLEYGYLLLPAMQALAKLWVWDGALRREIEQRLKYQDQTRLSLQPDGSITLLSAGAITRFAFEVAASACSARRPEIFDIRPDELPDLAGYGLRDMELFRNGTFCVATRVATSMKAMRDEQCAGTVFLQKRSGRWTVLGERTWPRPMETVRTVCIDPERGRFTLLLRSENSNHSLYAVQGTAEELCAGEGMARELELPQNKENCGCFAGGRLFFSAGELLLVYEVEEINYESALLLPAPITALQPDGERVNIQFGGQNVSVTVQRRKEEK